MCLHPCDGSGNLSEFLKKFHLNFTSSYLLEAKIIVIFSSIHLIILFFLYNKLIPFSPENNFGIIYLIPTLIYVICLVINIVGIQIAATQSPQEQHIIRIVPICNGKIYLTPHAENTTIWDAPIKTLFDGPLRKSQRHAKNLVKKHQSTSHTTHKKKFFQDSSSATVHKAVHRLSCSYIYFPSAMKMNSNSRKDTSLPVKTSDKIRKSSVTN